MLLETHFLAGHGLDSSARLQYLALLAREPELLKTEIAKCVTDPWWWVTGWAFTVDEHHSPPRRQFPALEYLRQLTAVYLGERMALIAKSRQMLVSWLFAALSLWDGECHEGRRLPVHTKKREDANYQVHRAWDLWEAQPAFLRAFSPVNMARCGKFINNRLVFDRMCSVMLALPEGSDHVRSTTASRLWEDEFQLQDDAAGILQGAMPALGLGKWSSGGSGGHLYLVGTARPGKMAEIYKDKAEALPSLGKGVDRWRTSEGCLVFRLHYSADPAKDRETPEGQAWYEAERRAWLAGGGTDWDWDAEYEISFEVCGGVRFYPEVSVEQHWQGDFLAWRDRPFYCGWDFGYHFPAFVCGQLNEHDQIVEFMVHRAEDEDFDVWAPKVLRWRVETFGRDAVFYDFIDPEGNHKDDKGETTVERMKRLGRQIGIEVRPRWRPIARDEGGRQVRRLLMRRADGRPGLVFAGLGGEALTVLMRLRLEAEKDEPEREHPYIDIFDALKYQICGMLDKNDHLQSSFDQRAQADAALRNEMELARRREEVMR